MTTRAHWLAATSQSLAPRGFPREEAAAGHLLDGREHVAWPKGVA